MEPPKPHSESVIVRGVVTFTWNVRGTERCPATQFPGIKNVIQLQANTAMTSMLLLSTEILTEKFHQKRAVGVYVSLEDKFKGKPDEKKCKIRIVRESCALNR